MSDLGKILVLTGLVLVVMGLMVWLGAGRGWLGKLPGDLHLTKGHFSVHVPIVTCLILSAVLTFLLWLFRR